MFVMAVLAVAVLALARVGAYLRKRDGGPERGPRDGEETSR